MVNFETAQKPVYFPRGVSDPSGKIGYMANFQGGIESLALDSGQTRWTSAAGTLPLIVFDHSLAAARRVVNQQNQMQLVVLDDSRPERIRLSSSPIVFPPWVSPLSPGEYFSSQVFLENDVLIYYWQDRQYYAGGVPPPAEIMDEAKRQSNGRVVFNLTNAQTEMLFSPPEAIFPDENEIFAPHESVFQIKTWEVAGRLTTLYWDFSGGQPAVSLKSWNPAANQPIYEIRLAEGDSLVPKVTPDGLYVLIHAEQAPSLTGPSVIPWTVFSVETGNPIANLTYQPGTREVTIINSRVFYLVAEQKPNQLEMRLVAKDLFSDRIVWERILHQQGVKPGPALRPSPNQTD